MTRSATARAGYYYTLALCAAIEAATAQGDFSYRGADLRYAVRRELYTRLINEPRLQGSFAGVGSAPALRARLDRDVAVRVLGTPVPVPRGPAERARRALVAARWRLAPSCGVTVRGATAERPVAFLLDAPKFTGFLAPVFAHFDVRDTVVLSAVGELSVQLNGSERPWVAMHEAASLPGPDHRSLGAGLRDRIHVAAYFDRLTAALRATNPRALVVVEGNSMLDELGNRAARALGIPCVCIQQGWSPIVHNGFRDMTFDAMLVWGEGFADLLAEHNPDQRFVVTGAPSLDVQPTPTGVPLVEKLGGRTAAGVFLQGTSMLNAPEDIVALETMVERLARRLPGQAVIVRAHPARPFSPDHAARLAARPEVVDGSAPDHTLREVLNSCRVAISIYSTTLLEGVALGRPGVIFNPTSLPRYVPDLETLGAGRELRDVEEAEDVVVELMTDDIALERLRPGMGAVRDRFFDGLPANAGARVAAAVEAAATAGV